MKDIILKAIGEDVTIKDMYPDATLDPLDKITVRQVYEKEAYNQAKAEMRAKIPQIVEEVKELMQAEFGKYSWGALRPIYTYQSFNNWVRESYFNCA